MQLHATVFYSISIFHYPTGDLQRRQGLLDQGVTVQIRNNFCY